MKPTHLNVSLVLLTAATALTPAVAQAMPMFARKYRMDCSACHAPVAPRLNDVGYKFRRAGFRMPEQIGQEEAADFTLGDYFSGRIRSEYGISRQDAESEVQGAAGDAATESRFQGQEITLYPLTGSFERYFATQTEIGLGPGETPEIENAYVRAVWGNQGQWLQLRAGVFHPIEGFGGSDRPIGLSGPLFESIPTGRSQETFVRVSELDRVGLELGAQWRNTSFNVAVLSPLRLGLEEGEIEISGTGESLSNGKDLLLSLNQIIGTRSGIGAYWARGAIQLPVDGAGFVSGTMPATWSNDYNRFALFGTAGIGRFTALAGASLGLDHDRDPTAGQLSTFRSAGAFVEGNAAFGAHAAAYVRLDYFDPARGKDEDQVAAITAGCAIYTAAFFLVPELRYLRRAAGDEEGNNLGLTIRAVAIY